MFDHQCGFYLQKGNTMWGSMLHNKGETKAKKKNDLGKRYP